MLRKKLSGLFGQHKPQIELVCKEGKKLSAVEKRQHKYLQEKDSSTLYKELIVDGGLPEYIGFIDDNLEADSKRRLATRIVLGSADAVEWGDKLRLAENSTYKGDVSFFSVLQNAYSVKSSIQTLMCDNDDKRSPYAYLTGETFSDEMSPIIQEYDELSPVLWATHSKAIAIALAKSTPNDHLSKNQVFNEMRQFETCFPTNPTYKANDLQCAFTTRDLASLLLGNQPWECFLSPDFNSEKIKDYIAVWNHVFNQAVLAPGQTVSKTKSIAIALAETPEADEKTVMSKLHELATLTNDTYVKDILRNMEPSNTASASNRNRLQASTRTTSADVIQRDAPAPVVH